MEIGPPFEIMATDLGESKTISNVVVCENKY